MDVHKKTHVLAVYYPWSKEPEVCTILNNEKDIKKAVKHIERQAPGELRFCYEAGVCGFSLQRQIKSLGHHCDVIAPSLIPSKAGERVNTDRRAAKNLGMLYSSALLTVVSPPDEQQEADRELLRRRDCLREDLLRARHRIAKFLLRNGFIYTAGESWTQKHLGWMRGIAFANKELNEAFNDYYDDMTYLLERLASCDRKIEELALTPKYRDAVKLLCCFHGIKTLSAMCIMTEIFDFNRFKDPRQLMSYLGLTPSEHSSGGRVCKGGITKAGNKRLRRIIIEIAWHYRHRHSPSRELLKRRENQPQYAIDIANKAGMRLSKRYRSLKDKNKTSCKATVAIARELTGFIWALMMEYNARTA